MTTPKKATVPQSAVAKRPEDAAVVVRFSDIVADSPIPTEPKWMDLGDGVEVELVPFVDDREAVRFLSAARQAGTREEVFFDGCRRFVLASIAEGSRETFNGWLVAHPMPPQTMQAFAATLYNALVAVPLDDASASSDASTS
jgi:hypothetical protein